MSAARDRAVSFSYLFSLLQISFTSILFALVLPDFSSLLKRGKRLMASEGGSQLRDQIRCAHCSCLFFPNPRVKNQRYCSNNDCQRARKRRWQREKLVRDPDYRQNQRDCNEQWRSQNLDYWKNYRLRNPKYTSRNRELQKLRDNRHSKTDLAKMDASQPLSIVESGTYYLVPELADLAKMDASPVKVHLISVT